MSSHSYSRAALSGKVTFSLRNTQIPLSGGLAAFSEQSDLTSEQEESEELKTIPRQVGTFARQLAPHSIKELTHILKSQIFMKYTLYLCGCFNSRFILPCFCFGFRSADHALCDYFLASERGIHLEACHQNKKTCSTEVSLA